MLKNKHIVVGICGGIAAYKAVDVVGRLKRLGASIDVIMTKSACEFVTPLTFRAFSKTPVIVNMFENSSNYNIAHIELAEKTDAVLIVPATANILGKIAYGLADDILSTTIMATKSPVFFAPAMNNNMYSNCIVQNNIKMLQNSGYHFIEPETGRLACGTVGKGRLASIDSIIDEVVCELAFPKDLKGLKILITAGPTRERLDPVRFITNYSTGKMGYAIANVARSRGANVTLVTGPTSLNRIKGVNTIEVNSALEMYEACMMNYKKQDIIIKSAAVGDFRPTSISEQKIKRSDELSVNLTQNPDILAELGRCKTTQTLVGFCMETQDLVEHAKQKLNDKNLDLIVANSLVEDGAGFAGDTNRVTLVEKDDCSEELPLMSKDYVANAILDRVLALHKKKHTA